jgi:hypothetical protein
MKYSDYILTEYWRQTRKKVLSGNSNHCYVCLITLKLHVHHMEYNLFNEKLNKLLPLCASCHSSLHHYYGHGHIDKHYIIKAKRLMRYGVIRKWAFILAQLKNHKAYDGLWFQIQQKGITQYKESFNGSGIANNIQATGV